MNSAMFLAAPPMAVEGMARILDIGGTMVAFNDSVSAEFADWLAAAADWGAVGDCIRSASSEFAAQNGLEPVQEYRVTPL